jgi:nucleoside-diphosphate-sugar epimerase
MISGGMATNHGHVGRVDMHVLVTGHEGYIGSVLVPLLISSGHTVIGIDTGYFREKPVPYNSDSYRSVQKDIRDITLEDLSEVDAVIHLAALSNDPLGDLDESWTYQINYKAPVQLAELSKSAGVKRFLFSSSCSVYGQAGEEGLVNEESPVHPLTAYAVSKLRVEEDLASLADDSFCPIFLRNATAYGWSPRFRADLVLNNLACWAYTTGEIRILSDGSPWRPLVHVEDIALAFLILLDAPRDLIHNQVLNVGVNDQNYRVRDLAKFVQSAFPGSRISYAGGGEPDPRSYRVDFSKLRNKLTEYLPAWDAESGAVQLAQFYQEVDLKIEEFTGPRYTRLAQIKELLDTRKLDETLRWRG